MRGLSRREFLRAATTAGAITAVSGFGLTGCGGGSGGGNDLTMWAFDPNRADYERHVAAERVKQKGAKFSKLSVNNYQIPDIYQKLFSALNAHSGAPDLVDLEVSNWQTFIKNKSSLKAFVPLNDLIGSELADVAKGSATQPWTWDGTIYGLGNELNPTLMYTRYDLFKRAGIPLPIKDWETDFIQKGKELKAKTGAYAIEISGNSPVGLWYTLGLQRGGDFFDEHGKWVGDSEIMTETLQYIHDLVHKHDIATFTDNQDAAVYADFKHGKVATATGAPWYQGFMKVNEKPLSGKWHIQYLPSWKHSQYKSVTNGGTGMAIVAGGNKDAAWDFIKSAVLTKQGSLTGYRLHNLFPTYKPAWSAPVLNRKDPFFDNEVAGEFIRTAAQSMAPFHTSPFYYDVVSASDSVLNRVVGLPVMQDKTTVTAALSDATAQVKKMK